MTCRTEGVTYTFKFTTTLQNVYIPCYVYVFTTTDIKVKKTLSRRGKGRGLTSLTGGLGNRDEGETVRESDTHRILYTFWSMFLHNK